VSKVTCPSCGKALAQETPFCPHCGAVVDAGAAPTATSPLPDHHGPSRRPATPHSPRAASGAFGHGRFSPGTPLGERYRIVGLLGRGGMGEVYRADDLHLGQPVALKFLPENVERDPVALERFVGEVRTARQISHPNVCRVYDLGEFEGRRFLSMEYIDGEDLRSLLKRIGRLPEDKGLQIARQLCAGLAAMHDRGVLHRDLKPANVMIDSAGRVRLTDFGLAAAFSDGTNGEIAGTPAYMAPEQLEGGALSAQTDLYALGLVLFELFTGERVHKTDRPDELRERHRAPRTGPLSKTSGTPLDPAIGRVIERCLEKDPSRRPASAIAVAAALPGGDPLAAALAAGETPSPQLVAAAGAEGTLPSKIGVPLLVALLILTGAVAWFHGRGLYTAIVPFPYSAEVLATKAQEMLGRLGYPDKPADSGYGFRSDSSYPKWIEKRDSSAQRWQQLASVREPLVRFWYRTSPQRMAPTTFLNGRAGIVLDTDDPPRTLPGMAYIALDLNGRLTRLEAVMPDRETDAPQASAPDWSRLFAEAGLDMAAFRSVQVEWKAPAGADVRAAWVGPGADASGAELRVEAAAHRGRPMFFSLISPWTEPADVSAVPEPLKASDIIAFTLFLSVLGFAILLAIRNVRANRADTRGAMRLAFVLGLAILTSGLFESRISFSFLVDFSAFLMVVSGAAFYGLMTWTLYVALEPHARRRWPQMLVSWSRLLEGRWRDPLIGRDLLVGSAIGMAIQLVGGVYLLFKTSPRAPTGVLAVWMGLGQALSGLPYFLPSGIWVAFWMLLLLVGLRIVLRRERFAMVAFVVLLAALDILPDPSPVNIAITIMADVALVLVATRFGLMAVFAMVVPTPFINVYGVTLTPPAPLVAATMVGLAALLAPGVFGFFTSRARGSAGTGKWLDE